MEGVGSLWNANSWHWEEKNYNKAGEEMLKQHLLELQIPNLSITNIIEVNGEASINIRKGKRICVFEYSTRINT